ncbi:MAG: HAD family hydrolase [Bacillota bacterium]
MLSTLLFDLDGTLLPMDVDKFMKHYLGLLAPRMTQFLAPEDFIRELLAATTAMARNDNPNKTNREVFNEVFFGKTGLPEDEVIPVFEDFYRRDFPSLAVHTSPTPMAREVVETAKNKGLKIVVATNPLFPLMAVLERLRWAGLGQVEFDLITSYEEMHFSKPNLNYYREILARLNVEPEQCMIVGNDVEEDLVAGKLNMRTFLVRDCLIQRGPMPVEPDYVGSLADLLSLIKGFESIR